MTKDISKPYVPTKGVRPEYELSQLIRVYGGVEIAPETIRNIIASDFNLVSKLAHQIHDEMRDYPAELSALVLQGSRIEAIKLYRDWKNCGLRDAMDYVDKNWITLRADACEGRVICHEDPNLGI